MNHPPSIMGPVTDTTPTLIQVGGRPTAWLHLGRVWPYVAGGSDAPPADAPPADDAPPTGDEAPPADDAPAKVDMTPEQLEQLLKKTSARATRAAEERLAEEARKASLSEVERLQAEKVAAEKAAAGALAAANRRAVAVEAKLAAVNAGVKPDRVDAFLRTLDITDIEVDDDGAVDAAALSKVIKDGLTAVPEFKGTTAPPAGGGDLTQNADGAKPTTLAAAVEAQLRTA